MKSMNKRIIKCKPESNYRVWVQFNDGLEGIVDLSHLKEVPAFKRVWKTIEDFNQVRIDPFTHTITWGEHGSEVDINPAELRKEVLQRINHEIPER